MQASCNRSQQVLPTSIHRHSCYKAAAQRVRATAVASNAVERAASNAAQQAILDWHDVDKSLQWRGNEEAALAAGSPASTLPAPWKMMLLSDGSVTRHLQLLTGQPIQVECLSMDLLSGQQPHQPPEQALQIPGPLVQRQVLLWSQSSPRVPLVYAASWWGSASVDKYLADRDLPIWVSLAKGHLELYREIQVVALGDNPQLEQHFGCKGPFWSRQYFFWHEGKPLTLIHEVFSNKLEAYLGPNSSSSDSSSTTSSSGSIGGCGSGERLPSSSSEHESSSRGRNGCAL